MKNRIFISTALYVTLLSTPLIGDTKKQSTDLSTANSIDNTDIACYPRAVFVESGTAMGEGLEGHQLQKDIFAKRDSATAEVQERAKKNEKAKSEFVSKAATMSDAARDKEEKKLVKMERDLKDFIAEKEEDLRSEMQAATEILAQAVEVGVRQLAEDKNLDIVFDKMTGRALYVSDKFDLTAEAITYINKNYEIKLAQNKQIEATKVAQNKTTHNSKNNA